MSLLKAEVIFPILVLTLIIGITFTCIGANGKLFNIKNGMSNLDSSKIATIQNQQRTSNYKHTSKTSFEKLDEMGFENTSFIGQAITNHKRGATAIKKRLWDEAIIPYIIEPRFTARSRAIIRTAMEAWEVPTCLIFKEKEPSDKNYLKFTVSVCGCCSKVGKQGTGAQGISIAKGCDVHGTVLHELGHAIGFKHEHVRPDRDTYVSINISNVKEKYRYNFEALNTSEIDSLGEPYDFESIMHYGRTSFSKNETLKSIEVNNPFMANGTDVGQRDGLSTGDIRQTNKLYGCPNCGATLVAPAGSFNFSSKQKDECQWRIKAAYGDRIKLNITSFNVTYSENCTKNYLEIRDGPYRKSPSLGRYCGNDVPGVLFSSGKRMWVAFKSSRKRDQFSAEYVPLCEEDIKKDEGFINSSGFPHELYLPNSYCVWNITVNEKFVVLLSFEMLDLEPAIFGTCYHDYLEVRDGHGNSAPRLGRFCTGKYPRKQIRSSGNKLTLVFRSGIYIQRSGFSVRFWSENTPSEPILIKKPKID